MQPPETTHETLAGTGIPAQTFHKKYCFFINYEAEETKSPIILVHLHFVTPAEHDSTFPHNLTTDDKM